jgi:hypothetical protein
MQTRMFQVNYLIGNRKGASSLRVILDLGLECRQQQ